MAKKSFIVQAPGSILVLGLIINDERLRKRDSLGTHSEIINLSGFGPESGYFWLRPVPPLGLYGQGIKGMKTLNLTGFVGQNLLYV